MAPRVGKYTEFRAHHAATSRSSLPYSAAHLPLPGDALTRAAECRQDAPDEYWHVSKRDKRHIKHGLLLQKVREGGVQRSAKKRRRPTRKLSTHLRELGEALPVVSSAHSDAGTGVVEEWEAVSESDEESVKMAVASGMRRAHRQAKRGNSKVKKMAMMSMQHRPGAMKRKRTMEAREMERFARNLAQMAPATPMDADGGDGHPKGTMAGALDADEDVNVQTHKASERWAALRSFISSTMETDSAFKTAP